MPDSSIYALAQDGEGYIWVGTEAGPYRFDGARFAAWNVLTNTNGKTTATRALQGATDGSMWVGFVAPGGIAVFRRGVVRVYGEADGLPPATVSTIVEDPDGNHWAGTASGLYLLRGERWERWDEDRGVPSGPIAAAYVMRDRRLLVTAGRALLQFDRESQRFAEIASMHDDPRAIGEDPFGAILVSDQEDGFRRALPGSARLETFERGRGRALVRDRRNNIWVGTAGQGVWRVKFDPDGRVLFTERATALTGLLADGVVAVMEDREGNIWAGTPEGLNRLTPHKVAQVTNIGLVAGVERGGAGTLWVGTVDELLEMPSGSDRMSSRRHPLDGARLRALHADTAGTLWVATNHGLSRLRDGALVPLPLRNPSTMPLTVDSITSDGASGVWVFDNEHGLLHWRNGAFESTALPASLAGTRVGATMTDSTGRAWFTFSNGEVATSRDGDFRVYGKSDGIDGGVYQALYEDGDHVIWLGGTNGLTRYNGRFVTTRSDRGFPVANVTAIVDDGQGTLWVGSGAGILQIRTAEWEQLLGDPSYQPKFRLYDRSDGLAGLPFVYSLNRRAIRSDDGRLWFVTGRGLTIIDPAELGEDDVPHPVRVEGVLANGARVTMTPGSTLSLPAGTNRLEVEYSAINLTSPLRQHFRYRLEGFDSEWVDAGARRQAFYTNLPPRAYTFRVMTSDADGGWSNAEAATLEFAIQPVFYQTTWFLGLGVVAVALAIGASWRLHVRRVRRQFALLIGERSRLSRELHDTLLQSLVGIALQFDAMANDPQFTSSETQRWEFVRMRRRVEDYIREARQSISDLRSPKLETQDLVTALREAGEREVEGRAIELSFHQRGTPRAYPAGLEEQMLKIGREAIVNAARHAHADRIAVELESSDQALTLRVTDNGTGFDPRSVASDGTPHYGLTSMRERAEDIGGQFTIESSEGRGTRVEATVPLQDAPRGKRHVEPALH
ncbi:MAG TPA: two-component regulator propeller domain-containing protein [Vicinamibacterales bacterium]|nr:two-component regulator propeller domain-containing protein [Vicinamibacterales bacterium]